MEEGRKGGREEGRKGGREEGRKGGREEGRKDVSLSAAEDSQYGDS
jgi:flagellar biosynthesis/type III secretory pathway protein FliH